MTYPILPGNKIVEFHGKHVETRPDYILTDMSDAEFLAKKTDILFFLNAMADAPSDRYDTNWDLNFIWRAKLHPYHWALRILGRL